jgi:ribonuclease HI
MGSTQTKKEGLVWYTDGSDANKNFGAGVYRWGSRKGHSFNLGLHTMVFQAEIYAIKACIMETIDRGYTSRNIYILPDDQAGIEALDISQINSNLVWDYHQSLVKLAERDRVQMVWVPAHMGIDGNETSDQLARQDSSYPLTGSETALCISAKVARGVIRDWTSRKHHRQSIHRQR